MVNCNPETVSTDYDTADRLYFEPLTLEDVLEIYHAERPAGPIAGVIVQLGGQTPLRLAQALKDAGVPIVGTSPEAIHLAEERGAFGRCWPRRTCPPPSTAWPAPSPRPRRSPTTIGYPVLVRPCYVLGGRGMEIVYDESTLASYIDRATEVSPEHPVLVDQFLDDAVEIDVDALYDGSELYLGGVMEHIEEAGIHSGDSACALPPITLGAEVVDRIRALHRGHRRRGRGPRPDQHPVRAGRRHAVRAGGQPAGVADGAVRLQGHRDPAGQGRRPGHARRDHRRAAGRGPAARRRRRRGRDPHRPDRGQGGGDAVQPVPHGGRDLGRHHPRTGDEVDRRGDGHRHRLRHRVRQEPGGRASDRCPAGARCSSRWPTGTSGS